MKILSRVLFRLPIHLYKIGLGPLFGHRFLMLGHTGRVSGLTRHAVIEVVERDRDLGSYTVCSGLGAGSQWYRNITRNPEVAIQVGWKVMPALAVPLPPEEGAEVLRGYAARHPVVARWLMRMLGIEADGTPEGFRRAGLELPFVKLVTK